MPNKTRIEREIDEILEKSGDEPTPKPPGKRQFEPFSTKAPQRKSPGKSGAIRFDPGNLLILGLVVLAVAAFNPIAKLPLTIVGALMVVVGYASWFRKGGGSSRIGRFGRAWRRGVESRPTGESTDNEPQVKYWRGRRIEEKPGPPDSGNPNDRGKIIEFGPPDDDLDPGDRGKDEK